MIPLIAQPALREAGWLGATPQALAGDASARRYFRLHRRGGETAILMVAPPADRTAFQAFTSLANLLRAAGLSAPEIYAADAEAGIMVLEDLGQRDFTDLGAEEEQATDVVVDLLVHLARSELRPTVTGLTPGLMADMVAISLPKGPASDAALAELQALFAEQFKAPNILALRDFHAENLIWMPQRAGIAQVGLLDFQDAVLAPLGYDLVSFVKDARRDLDPQIQTRMTHRFATGLGLDVEDFARTAALLSLQRNLRIVGIFRRLAETGGKPGYLTHLPRVFGYIQETLTHPDLARCRVALIRALPELAA